MFLDGIPVKDHRFVLGELRHPENPYVSLHLLLPAKWRRSLGEAGPHALQVGNGCREASLETCVGGVVRGEGADEMMQVGELEIGSGAPSDLRLDLSDRVFGAAGDQGLQVGLIDG